MGVKVGFRPVILAQPPARPSLARLFLPPLAWPLCADHFFSSSATRLGLLHPLLPSNVEIKVFGPGQEALDFHWLLSEDGGIYWVSLVGMP